MKRRNFITSALAALPLSASAKTKRKKVENKKGFKIKAGEGRLHGHIQLKGVNLNVIDIKVSGKDTNGDLLIFEQTSLSPKRGTPLHIHPSQDEIFYVMDGEYRFKVGEEIYELKTGDSIFLPRAIPNALSQLSDKGKMLVTLQPAGKLEEFFLTMADLKTNPNLQEIAHIFEVNEMTVVGPPLKVD